MLIKLVDPQAEKDRMDMFHTIFSTVRSKRLHRAPILRPPPDAEEPCRILDLGTGTGIWAIDMADMYPFAEVGTRAFHRHRRAKEVDVKVQVIGTDLANIQPSSIPPNLRFRVPRDYESSIWSLGENSFDFIHLRMACGGVSQWGELYHKMFAHLKPQIGHIEQVEIDFRPRCDDGTVPEKLASWYHYLRDATLRGSKPIEYLSNTAEEMRRQGFVDIHEEVLRMPLNTWPSDRLHKDIGRWYNLGFTEGLEAMSLGPLTRVYKWPVHDIRLLVEDVRGEVNDRKNRVYNNLAIAT